MSSRKIAVDALQAPPLNENVGEPYSYLEAENSQYNEVQLLIVKYSEQYGIDATLPLEIARAESGYKNVPNFMYDGEHGKYSAYGIFQTTRTFWKHYCSKDQSERMDVEKNIECSVRVIAGGGVSNWSESKYLWEKKIPPVTPL